MGLLECELSALLTAEMVRENGLHSGPRELPRADRSGTDSMIGQRLGHFEILVPTPFGRKSAMTDDSNRTLSRRQFAARAAMAALSAAIVPSRVLGAQAPSKRLNIAAIGIGGMGGANLKACETENIVALCDVDTGLLGQDEGALPEGDLLHRLPRDAREGEGHRRRGHRDAGPHARHDHDGRLCRPASTCTARSR